MNLDDLRTLASEAKAEFQEAYAAYLKAQPGRDLTIKQGRMHQCRLLYTAAVHNFFDEYEKSHLL